MRSTVTLALFALAACQSPSPTDTAATTLPDTMSLAAPPATGGVIPAPFLGVWDENDTTCSESFSMTRFTISPNEIEWFGGTGDVTAVRGTGGRIEVDLSYVAEGSPTGEPEPKTTTLSLDDAGQLSLGLGDGREGLFRCSDDHTSVEGSLPNKEGDQTVAVRFSLGTTSMTLSDTLRAFALHDYLVRASNGQQLTAALRANGPGVPGVIVIREDTYGGPSGDFETVAPGEQRTTGSGYEWAGALPTGGTYRVRVAHSGPAANGGTVSPYTLTIEVE